jgi:hypothetical protein
MGRAAKRTERMRTVVDCLPYETKLAMLEGLDRYEIIAGAYSDRRGGVCPMLAAHRCGGRTDFRAFARAWDRFTGAGRARRVSGRELRTLRAQLERSVWNEERTRAELTRMPEERPFEPPAESPTVRRTKPMLGAWLLPFRDLEAYQAAVEAALSQMEELRSGGNADPDSGSTATPLRERGESVPC